MHVVDPIDTVVVEAVAHLDGAGMPQGIVVVAVLTLRRELRIGAEPVAIEVGEARLVVWRAVAVVVDAVAVEVGGAREHRCVGVAAVAHEPRPPLPGWRVRTGPHLLLGDPDPIAIGIAVPDDRPLTIVVDPGVAVVVELVATDLDRPGVHRGIAVVAVGAPRLDRRVPVPVAVFRLGDEIRWHPPAAPHRQPRHPT